MTARGFVYSHEIYLNDTSIYNDKRVVKAIPIGYKAVSAYEKMVYIQNGEEIKSFEHISNQEDGDTYVIFTTSFYRHGDGYKHYPDLSGSHSKNIKKYKSMHSLFQQRIQKEFILCQNIIPGLIGIKFYFIYKENTAYVIINIKIEGT